VVLPAGWGGLGARARALGAEVEFVAGGYEHAVYASKALATAWRVADGNVDGPYAAQVARALAQIVHEIAEELPVWPEVVWVPLGNGTTIAAIGAALAVLGWTTRVVGVTALANNSILASWPGVCHRSLEPHEVAASPAREPLVNWSALHGQAALDVLHAGRGIVVGVTDRQLVDARDLLGCYGVPASPAGAAGVAGLVAYGNRLAAGGTHVAVLTGR